MQLYSNTIYIYIYIELIFIKRIKGFRLKY